jgi:hypothetical protein
MRNMVFCYLALALWMGPLPPSVPAPPPTQTYGYLWPLCKTPRRCLVEPVPYVAQPGDLLFTSSGNPFVYFGLWLAGQPHPNHTGLIIGCRDGALETLEAGGPSRRDRVATFPLQYRLDYQLDRRFRPIVWIRRIKKPISAGQRTILQAFAAEQIGKDFASVHRLTHFMLGRYPTPTHVTQSSWFCSELVAEAFLQAGMVPAGKLRPEATMPADLFLDRCPDISEGWEPPALWNRCPSIPVGGPRHLPSWD